MIVSHHGLNGIGNKMMSNHLRHPQPFREGSLSPVFTGISIHAALSNLRFPQRNQVADFPQAICYNRRHCWGNAQSSVNFEVAGKIVQRNSRRMIFDFAGKTKVVDYRAIVRP
jgi:hypothetical protein